MCCQVKFSKVELDDSPAIEGVSKHSSAGWSGPSLAYCSENGQTVCDIGQVCENAKSQMEIEKQVLLGVKWW